MADNTTLNDNTTVGDTLALKELSHGGDTAKVQVCELGIITGSEGSYTLTEIVGGSGVLTAGVQRVAIATDDVNMAAIKTAVELIDDAIYIDDADWTATTSKHILAGGIFQSTPGTITDGDTGPLRLTTNGYAITQKGGKNSVVDTANSSTTPLAGGATFIGTAMNTLNYSLITISVFADQDSAADGLSVEWSSDGTNWDNFDRFDISASVGKIFSFGPPAKFARVVYTNGGTIQGAFRLETILRIDNQPSSSHRIADSIVGQDDAELGKVVITGLAPDTTFKNILSTNAGALKISIEDINGVVLPISSESIYVDDADWTALTSSHTLSGGIFQSSPGTITDGDTGPFRVTTNGFLLTANAGTFVVQEDGAALTALQLIDDPVFADDAPFTLASSKAMVAGAIRDDMLSNLAAAEGDVVPLRVDMEGKLHTKADVFGPGTIDTFGHVITGEVSNQIDVQFFRDTPANLTTVTVAGGGATSQVGGSGKWETSTATTASAKSESILSTVYRSGSELFCVFTATFTTPTDENSAQHIGLFDTANGIFIGFDGSTFNATVRNASSDTSIAKASWSQDTLTGAAGSLFTRDGVPEAIDFTKFNVFRIRFGWLGSAPVYFEAMSPDGEWVTFHKVLQPNLVTVATTETADLPVTLEVTKTAGDATNIIMTSNCWGAGLSTDKAPLSDTLTDDTLAPIARTVLAGKTAGGSYVNVQTTNSGNLKIALDEYDGVPTGSGTSTGALRVELPTNGTGIVGLAAGTSNIGDVDVLTNVTPTPQTSGGLSFFKSIDLDETEEEVKGTAGQIYGIMATNTASAVAFLKIYNATAASVTVGTTVPDLTLQIPPDNGGLFIQWNHGVAFGTAITVAATTLVADNDATAPAANQIVCSVFYK